jgi:hypothetical protein
MQKGCTTDFAKSKQFNIISHRKHLADIFQKKNILQMLPVSKDK